MLRLPTPACGARRRTGPARICRDMEAARTRSQFQPGPLGAPARTALEDPDNEVMFSAASIWEIAIKAALGRADFQVPPAHSLEAAKDSGFEELPVRSAAALLVATLPPIHRDPVRSAAHRAGHQRTGVPLHHRCEPRALFRTRGEGLEPIGVVMRVSRCCTGRDHSWRRSCPRRTGTNGVGRKRRSKRIFQSGLCC